ncbi:hypothetical protein HOY82DRAFT_42679 [Tuber indicum]|nr:hypothetical protein HOY82DRAFT_42679 [Tuber indicum]
MLLERDDVNPNLADTEYGRTPLSWAAHFGREGVVKLLLARKDVHTTTSDSTNQTPLSLARARGWNRIIHILHKRDTVNSGTADHAPRHPFSPPLAVGPNEPEPVSDPQDSLSDPANCDLPSTEQPTLHQPPPIPPQMKVDIRPNDPRSILAYTRPADRYFTIACLVCLLALLVYILPSSSPETFRLRKLLPSDVIRV